MVGIRIAGFGSWLTRAVRQSILLVMCFGLIGAPGVLLQGVAWVDMAYKMGGMENLSAAIFEAEPCDLCEAANRLRTGEGSPDAPAVPTSTELLKLVARVSDGVDLLDAEDQPEPDSAWRTPAPDFISTEYVGSLIAPPPRAA